MLKKMPTVISGLMLALAALGNLLQSYSENIRLLFGFLSLIIFVLLTLKIIFNFKDFKEEMNNPIVASVIPTYSMTIMLLSGYLKGFVGNTANIFWYFGVFLHIFFIIYFTVKFVFKFELKNVFASWFIVYVGIVVASVTGKAFNEQIGKIAFVFGLISYIILLFIVLKRIKNIEIPEPALPTKIILAAPGSLCLAGYMSIYDNKNIYLTIGLLILSQIIYFCILFLLTKMLKLKFYPSYSAFTFPLVISAIALKLSVGFLINQGFNLGILKYLVIFETTIATLIVLYVLFRYINFIFKTKKHRLKNSP
ncbi:TDT family transporter [Miniphocaeibacter halophilus]|uniref:TDT family transporter n=1 Tax=Miniphocaeibacter halophilus TaxID=2931922 RepID=A0AC61MQQ8_9FIRM|nr:TDT family transporter [Miniphocaeibacter halophilus]QQK07942.1 TDT family transporter [Miniphocaeibacter halophilus]